MTHLLGTGVRVCVCVCSSHCCIAVTSSYCCITVSHMHWEHLSCRLLSSVVPCHPLTPALSSIVSILSLNQTDGGKKNRQLFFFLTKTHFYTSLIQEHGLQSITVWNNQTALSNHFVQTAFPQECYGKTHLCTVKQKPLVCILLIHFCNTHWSTVCSRFMKLLW